MMTDDEQKQVTQAIAVCAEITGVTLKDNALLVMVDDLAHYPFADVMQALQRCRRELSGRLTLAAIFERLNDGWPTADEAFANLVEGWQDDRKTIITTKTAQLAAQDAYHLWVNHDRTGARMAFKGAYERAVGAARAEYRLPDWCVSAGTDAELREKAILAAVESGRLPRSEALVKLPFVGTAYVRMSNCDNASKIADQTSRTKLGKITKLLADKIMLQNDPETAQKTPVL